MVKIVLYSSIPTRVILVITRKPLETIASRECLLFSRYISHIPLGLVHKALVDSSIGGYKIPKGTQVWTNLWHLQHRWDYWTTPWRFMPERFLDKNGQVVPPDHVNRKRYGLFIIFTSAYLPLCSVQCSFDLFYERRHVHLYMYDVMY